MIDTTCNLYVVVFLGWRAVYILESLLLHTNSSVSYFPTFTSFSVLSSLYDSNAIGLLYSYTATTSLLVVERVPYQCKYRYITLTHHAALVVSYRTLFVVHPVELHFGGSPYYPNTRRCFLWSWLRNMEISPRCSVLHAACVFCDDRCVRVSSHGV